MKLFCRSNPWWVILRQWTSCRKSCNNHFLLFCLSSLSFSPHSSNVKFLILISLCLYHFALESFPLAFLHTHFFWLCLHNMPPQQWWRISRQQHNSFLERSFGRNFKNTASTSCYKQSHVKRRISNWILSPIKWPRRVYYGNLKKKPYVFCCR